MTLDLTLWEIVAYIDGYNEANAEDKPAPMSDDEFDEMLSMHNVKGR